jgi:uncharacterized protein
MQLFDQSMDELTLPTTGSDIGDKSMSTDAVTEVSINRDCAGVDLGGKPRIAHRYAMSQFVKPITALGSRMFVKMPYDQALASRAMPLALYTTVVSSIYLVDHHRAILFAAVGLASFLSSIGGFAFAAIGGAMLFHMGDDPVEVVQIMMTCSIANQAKMSWELRRSFDWSSLRWFLIGGIFGLPIGVWLLLNVEKGLYIHALGVFLVVYGGYMFFRRPFVLCQHIACDIAAGFLGGIGGGVMGFPGASVTIWCGTKGWDKNRQRAVFQPFILILQIAALVLISMASSGHHLHHDPFSFVYIPAGLTGTALGLAFYQKLSDKQFSRAVNALLIVSGVGFLA